MDQQTTEQLRERLAGERGVLRRQLRELGARADAEGIEEPDLDAGFADAGQAAAERSSLLTLVRWRSRWGGWTPGPTGAARSAASRSRRSAWRHCPPCGCA